MDSAQNLNLANKVPTTSPNGSGDYFSANLKQLEEAIEKFKQTGQVDSGEIDFAKTQVLPQSGLKPSEINDMGPVAVMVKLQELQTKGTFPSTNGATIISNSTQPSSNPPISEPNSQPSNQNPSTLPNMSVNLSTADIEKLTKDLSSEIDEEIKKQMAAQHVLEQAQEKVDEVLAEQQNKSNLEEEPQISPKVTTSPSPLAEVNKNLDLNSKIQGKNLPQETKPEPEKAGGILKEHSLDEERINLDPLSASIEQAIRNLKEGDKIGNEWTLKKTLSTSFGNHKAPFFELENKAGAKWTLSPEEMREVMRTELAPKKEAKSTSPSLPDLSPKPSETLKHKPPEPDAAPTQESLATRADIKPAGKIDFKKVAEKVRSVVAAPVSKPKPIAPTNLPAEKQKVQEEKERIQETRPKIVPKIEVKIEEKPPVSPVHKIEPKLHTEQEIKERTEEVKTVSSDDLKLTQRQIEFLNKLHSDQTTWHTFTSFKPEEWEKLFSLYSQGKLINLGIDAHPLIDRLMDSDFGETVDIRKGDSITKILEEAGYNLNWTNADAKILGVHIIANHRILSDSRKKLEISGLTVEPLPSEKDVIDLVHGAENGNHQSFYKLQEALQTLPINNKFKVIKPSLLDEIRNFFKH